VQTLAWLEPAGRLARASRRRNLVSVRAADVKISNIRFTKSGGVSVSLFDLNNESLVRYYESIRNEVETDRASTRHGNHRFFADGNSITQYAAAI
jgi:hypothetical protein